MCGQRILSVSDCFRCIGGAGAAQGSEERAVRLVVGEPCPLFGRALESFFVERGQCLLRRCVHGLIVTDESGPEAGQLDARFDDSVLTKVIEDDLLKLEPHSNRTLDDDHIIADPKGIVIDELG